MNIRNLTISLIAGLVVVLPVAYYLDWKILPVVIGLIIGSLLSSLYQEIKKPSQKTLPGVTNFELYKLSESPYYIACFTDLNGVRRFLPTKKRGFLKRWVLTNCPTLIDDKNSFAINSNKTSSERALKILKEGFHNVETYLKLVNDGF